jgi:hypothetical protein
MPIFCNISNAKKEYRTIELVNQFHSIARKHMHILILNLRKNYWKPFYTSFSLKNSSLI